MPINSKVSGNLLDMAENGEFDVIAHGCNCFHTMGSGIAGQIASRYPEAPMGDIKRTRRGDPLKLGTNCIVELVGFDFLIVNMYTQYRFGTGMDVDYCAVKNCFSEINNLRRYHDYRIGIPMIGAGLAGGDWKVIEHIINQTTPNLDITLVVWGGK